MDEKVQNNIIKNRVLMIAYSFPPVGSDRSIRTLKFIKYLPYFGWQPFVLTLKHPIVPNYDESLIKEVPVDIKVFRTRSIEEYFWYTKFKNVQKKKRKDHFFQNILKQIGRYLIIPDSRIGWIPFTVFRGIRIIKKESIDIIYVSAEPFSSFVSATFIKKLTGCPLILDFRDDWVGFNKYFRKKNVWSNFWETILERFVVKNADAVICVNENIKEDIKKRHSIALNSNSNFFCIYNGFDSEDFIKARPLAEMENDRFYIVYTGSLYPRRSAKFFLEALKLIIQERPQLRFIIKVLFAGNICPQDALLMDELIFHGIVENKGFLPHQQVLSLLKSAHLLLFIEDQAPNSNRVLTGKLFEYMAAEKPILALAGDGLVKDIILSLCIGRVVSSENIEEIKKYLISFVSEFQENGSLYYFPHQEAIKQFERREQTKFLSQIMNNLLKHKKLEYAQDESV